MTIGCSFTSFLPFFSHSRSFSTPLISLLLPLPSPPDNCYSLVTTSLLLFFCYLPSCLLPNLMPTLPLLSSLTSYPSLLALLMCSVFLYITSSSPFIFSYFSPLQTNSLPSSSVLSVPVFNSLLSSLASCSPLMSPSHFISVIPLLPAYDFLILSSAHPTPSLSFISPSPSLLSFFPPPRIPSPLLVLHTVFRSSSSLISSRSFQSLPFLLSLLLDANPPLLS